MTDGWSVRMSMLFTGKAPKTPQHDADYTPAEIDQALSWLDEREGVLA